MTLMRRSLLKAAWTGINSPPTAVVADPVLEPVVDHRLVIDVNVRDGYVVHRAVVVKCPVAPVPALVAMTEVAEAVIHTTIEPDMRTPVSGMPEIEAFIPSPI